MKHIFSLVRLILIISFCFMVVFLIAGAVAFLQIRIDAIRSDPVLSQVQGTDLGTAAQKVLPLMIYFATLLGISYTARKGVPIPLSIICLAAIGMAWTLAVSFGVQVLERIPLKGSPGRAVALGEPGLIVSHPDRSLIFLQDPGNAESPQVIAIPDSPLIYRSQGIPQNTAEPDYRAELYPGLLQSAMVSLLGSMFRDFDFAARQFQSRFKEGFEWFILYAFGLIFLLSSLRFIMDMSGWPMANLFLGILAFRGVLALEWFLDSGPTQQFLGSLIGGRFPSGLISPVAFCTLGIIIILYTALVHLGKSRRKTADEDY